MKFSLDSAFYKRWLRNSLYIFSIFSVVNYISEGVHDGSYFFIEIFGICIIVGFVFSLFNLNLQERKDERT